MLECGILPASTSKQASWLCNLFFKPCLPTSACSTKKSMSATRGRPGVSCDSAQAPPPEPTRSCSNSCKLTHIYALCQARTSSCEAGLAAAQQDLGVGARVQRVLERLLKLCAQLVPASRG
jgi:hypothetical protein